MTLEQRMEFVKARMEAQPNNFDYWKGMLDLLEVLIGERNA